MKMLQIGRLLIFILISASVLGACGAPYTFRGTELEPAKSAPDFTLTDHNGLPFQLSAQQGNVTILFFGFTSCPDICPTELADLAAVRQELGADAERVRVAMITVDPEQDTEQALQRYVTQFDPTFIGLRGNTAELESVYQAYGVTRIPATERGAAHSETHGSDHDADHTATTMDVVHSGYIYIIDRDGNWRVLFDVEDPIDDLVSDVRHLVRVG